MTETTRTPITEAGPALALAVNHHAGVIANARDTYYVRVHPDGVTVEWFDSELVRLPARLHLGPAVALNLRGLLQAIRAGAIA